MRTAFNDFFYEKRGIYGVLHVMILLLSLFLIVDISIDTFNNIPFISQTSYLKTQFWICMFLFPTFHPARTQRMGTGDRRRLANFEPGLRTLRLLPDDVAGNGLFLQPDLFRDRTEGEP